MGHPLVHAESSARRYGGVAEDYIEIHDFMDSSKAAFPDNRHRALTHNTWFIFVVEKCFGREIELTCPTCRFEYKGKGVCDDCGYPGPRKAKKAKVRYICEQHILEDYGGKYIPTAADFLEGLDFQPWMNNGVSGAPTSHRKLSREGKTTRRRAILLD